MSILHTDCHISCSMHTHFCPAHATMCRPLCSTSTSHAFLLYACHTVRSIPSLAPCMPQRTHFCSMHAFPLLIHRSRFLLHACHTVRSMPSLLLHACHTSSLPWPMHAYILPPFFAHFLNRGCLSLCSTTSLGFCPTCNVMHAAPPVVQPLQTDV